VEFDSQKENPTTKITIAKTNQSDRFVVIGFYPASQLAMS